MKEHLKEISLLRLLLVTLLAYQDNLDKLKKGETLTYTNYVKVQGMTSIDVCYLYDEYKHKGVNGVQSIQELLDILNKNKGE